MRAAMNTGLCPCPYLRFYTRSLDSTPLGCDAPKAFPALCRTAIVTITDLTTCRRTTTDASRTRDTRRAEPPYACSHYDRNFPLPPGTGARDPRHLARCACAG